LSELISLENRFLKGLANLASTVELLNELSSLDSSTNADSVAILLPSVQNYRRACLANVRTLTYLQQRARSTAQLLADTLALRDQVISKEQNASMLQLNKSAVFITTLTLVYLPASFVAVSPMLSLILHSHTN
jgi:hypothetical protein